MTLPYIPSRFKRFRIVPIFLNPDAPAGYFSGIREAIDILERTFAPNAVTLIFSFDWQDSGGTFLGHSGSPETVRGIVGQFSGCTYGAYRDAIKCSANTTTMRSAAQNLPATLPGGTFAMRVNQAWALGFNLPNRTNSSTAVIIGSEWSWSFTRTGGVSNFDFVGVLLHEITECMGRIRYANTDANGIGISEVTGLDLLSYTSGSLSYSSSGGYLSVDGGVTSINTWNTGAGDIMDWAGATTDCCNASLGTGLVPFSNVDIQTMNAIGWKVTPSIAAGLML